MTNLRKAAEMALEALEHFSKTSKEAYLYAFDDEIEALRTALAQPDSTLNSATRSADSAESFCKQELHNLMSVAGRMALELECLLLDTKDLSVVSKWWDTGMESLQAYRDFIFSITHGTNEIVALAQPKQEPNNWWDNKEYVRERFGDNAKVVSVKRGLPAGSFKKPQPEQVSGDTSDGYHTFNELYDFRKAYNAALFNEWAASGKYSVHKSKRHYDGEKCFGGGWFIVVAQLPDGQISNHYEMKDWDKFQVPETDKALFEYDNHTGKDVLNRLFALRTVAQPEQEPVAFIFEHEIGAKRVEINQPNLLDAYFGWKKTPLYTAPPRKEFQAEQAIRHERDCCRQLVWDYGFSRIDNEDVQAACVTLAEMIMSRDKK